MNQCKVLEGYAFFVQRVKEESRSKPIYEAIECAIDICIQEDILADFLKIHRAEVMSVSIFEYDAERHIAMEKEESKEEGREEGKIEGRKEGNAYKLIQLIIQKHNKLLPTEVADFLECDESLITEIYTILETEATSDYNSIYDRLLQRGIRI